MRLLFFDGASRCRVDADGKIYTGSNLENSIVERYGRYCDELALLLIEECENDNTEEQRQVDEVDTRNVEVSPVPDIYRPRINYFNVKLRRKKVVDVIAREIQKADRVIVRAPGRYYTNTALKLCRKCKKRYLIEAVDFVGDFMSFSRIKKVFAPYCEFTARREIACAPYVVYVSQHALQERYPTSGKSLGCSDVELPDIDPSVLAQRLAQDPATTTITFGTAGGVGKLKGQEYVIRALAELKAQGIANIEYHLAGSGSTEFLEYIQRLAADLNVESQVRFFGPIPHSQIFGWYDHLNAYIQPSFTEALGRSVIEAMGRAIPAACADVGGMKEYANPELFFRPGNIKDICSIMKKLLDPEVRRQQAKYSFNKAGEFQKSRLDPIRDKFYLDFMRS